MAIRTISAAGGNFNATSSWVEGIVPTSSDDVIGTASSGQLTVNVASNCRTIDTRFYNNTITLNNSLTCNGVAVNYIGASNSWTGNTTTSHGLTLGTNNSSLDQAGTNRIWRLLFTGANAFTLTSDIYCVHAMTTNNPNPTLNGFTLYSSGNFGGETNTVPQATGIKGTTKIVLDGSGVISARVSNTGGLEINTTGTYSTYGNGIALSNQVANATQSFSIINGNFTPGFFVYLYKQLTNNDIYSLNITKPINLLISNKIVNVTNPNINIFATNLNLNLLSVFPEHRLYTSDDGAPQWNIRTGSLSASTVILCPALRTNSTTTTPLFSYKGPTLKLNSDSTHTIGTLEAIGGGISDGSIDRPFIQSYTAGSVASLNLLSKTGSQIIDYNFKDINAVGQQIVAISATLSNTTNITTTYPSGSAAGGSWTFVN